MLISELKGWHWAITWDNPQPADSSALLTALGALGKLTTVQTKTTVLLAPKAGVRPKDIRLAITNNMHPSKGNTFYVNLRSGKAFEWGAATGFKWKSAV